jgi:molybdopterin converting factor small subunit
MELLMKIRIKSYFAVGTTDHLREPTGSKKEMRIEVREGTTIDELLKTLPAMGPPEQFDDIMLHVFVNGHLKGFDYVLQPGDVLDLHIPVSGG